MRGFVDFEYCARQAFFSFTLNIGRFRHEHDFNGYTIAAKVLNNKLYTPAFMANEVIQVVRNEGYSRNLDVVCDIPSSFRIEKGATSSKIMRMYFTYKRHSNFILVETGKGYRYRGINGVILDDDYNPLIICCKTYDIVGESIEYCGPVYLVSPRVFSNTDLISRFIVKNLIPNVSNIDIDTFHPSVLITDMIDDFVNKPKVPVGFDFNESIYRTLENHINEIVDEPQGILQGLDQSNTL